MQFSYLGITMLCEQYLNVFHILNISQEMVDYKKIKYKT